MDTIHENLKYFTEKYGDIYELYSAYGKAVDEEAGPLEEKTRRLIKVAISATVQNEYSLTTHIRKAFEAGCSQEDIEHTLLLVAPTAGFPAMMKGLLALRKIVEKND